MTYLDPIRQAAQEFAPPPTEPEHHFGDFDKEDPALKPVEASMTGSHFDDFDKEAPSEEIAGEPAPGSLKRTGREYARGIYRGVLGLGGAIHDAPSALFQNKEMTTAAKWIHDLGLDPPEDATWYEKGANTLGQLTPGAITGVGLTGSLVKPIIADLVASQITGPAGEKIGAKLGLGPGRSQLLGIGTSIAGSAGTAAGVSRVAGRFRPPTGEQILDSASKGYKAVENMPITWDPTALATNVTAPIARQMENSGADLTAPTAYKMLGKLQPTADESNGVSLGRLWGVQKNLKELAKQTDAQGHYTPDAHYAGQIVKSINQFMEAAQDNPNWALSGSEHLPTMSSTLAKANQDYSSAMWDDTFGKAYDKAKLRASTVTTGGNLPNNVRQEFAKFLDPFHPARALGLKPDELAQVNQIARGANRTQNLLRGLGGVAPESKLGLYAQATGLGMAAGGNLGGLMLPAVGVMGSLAKRASNRLQKGQIENLRNTVRSRSALAQSMRNGSHGGSAGEEAGEAAEAGLAGVLGEEAPEWVNRAAGAGADTGANAEKEKEADTGGYAMGHRLLKAVGGYDSSFFSGGPLDEANTEVAINRASGATPRDILKSVTSPTAQGIGQDIGMAMAPIEAYHGSPYDFDQFKSEKIGTGEGNQSYGYGLYFADKPGVAASYKPQGKWEYSGKPSSGDWATAPLEFLDNKIANEKGVPAALEDAKARMKDMSKFYNQTYAAPGSDYPNLYDSALNRLNKLDPSKIKQAGHMYQVEIGSEPEHFLDWDKPLSEQSEYVQDAVKKTGAKGQWGHSIYSGLGNNPSEGSKALQDAGIPGIRYLDQGSRGSGSGTHNYVVFDPSIIRIMRKYGIFGPAAVAGSQMGQQKKQRGGGYDDPRQEAFADPEAFRLRMARLAAAPQTGVGGGQPFPQTGIGGGMPMGRYQVGGYDWPWSMKGAKSRPEPVDTGNPGGSKYTFGSFSTVTRPKPPPRGGASMQDPQSDDVGGYDDSRMPRSRNVEDRTGYDESKLHWPWTIHANERKFYPQGDPIFQAPMIPPPIYTGQLGVAAGLNSIPGPLPTVGATGPINFGGGYDGVTGLLDQLAGPIVREHQQPWSLGRAANVLGQALGTVGAGPIPEINPTMADVISPTQFGAQKSPHVLAPQYSTGKSDRLPMGNVPWPQVPGGYGRRRRGGYGMGQVSPLAGGGGY